MGGCDLPLEGKVCRGQYHFNLAVLAEQQRRTRPKTNPGREWGPHVGTDRALGVVPGGMARIVGRVGATWGAMPGTNEGSSFAPQMSPRMLCLVWENGSWGVRHPPNPKWGAPPIGLATEQATTLHPGGCAMATGAMHRGVCMGARGQCCLHIGRIGVCDWLIYY